jgi:alkylation response protein AidB-like acyl-CoA dehydrogenase
MAIEIDAGRAFAYSVVWNQHKGGLVASGHMAAAAKVLATELNQRFFYTGCQILGLFSQVRESKWAPLQGKYEKEYQQCVSLNMGGGTSEIMRNLLCTLGLGLPRSW